MAATLRITHKAIGVEVRRGPYEIVVDGQTVGSVEMNQSVEIPIEVGPHSLQLFEGRNSSAKRSFDAFEGETISFRSTGKSLLPIFLLSFIFPRLGLSLRRVKA